MRALVIVLGVLLVVLGGLVWIAQGLNLPFAPRSFMTADRLWIVIGAVTVVAGVVVVGWARRQARQPRDATPAARRLRPSPERALIVPGLRLTAATPSASTIVSKPSRTASRAVALHAVVGREAADHDPLDAPLAQQALELGRALLPGLRDGAW